jgi:hypothetical protein
MKQYVPAEVLIAAAAESDKPGRRMPSMPRVLFLERPDPFLVKPAEAAPAPKPKPKRKRLGVRGWRATKLRKKMKAKRIED